MQYKNVSEGTIPVQTATGSKSVKPRETVLTAPKFAKVHVDAGLLELIPPPKKSASKKTVSKEQK